MDLNHEGRESSLEIEMEKAPRNLECYAALIHLLKRLGTFI